jgi:hypothetical protein
MKCFFVWWHYDEVYVIRHEAIGDNFNVPLARICVQQRQVGLRVAFLEKDAIAMIAALRYMVRYTWKYDTSLARHAQTVAGRARSGRWRSCAKPSIIDEGVRPLREYEGVRPLQVPFKSPSRPRGCGGARRSRRSGFRRQARRAGNPGRRATGLRRDPKGIPRGAR